MKGSGGPEGPKTWNPFSGKMRYGHTAGFGRLTVRESLIAGLLMWCMLGAPLVAFGYFLGDLRGGMIWMFLSAGLVGVVWFLPRGLRCLQYRRWQRRRRSARMARATPSVEEGGPERAATQSSSWD